MILSCLTTAKRREEMAAPEMVKMMMRRRRERRFLFDSGARRGRWYAVGGRCADAETGFVAAAAAAAGMVRIPRVMMVWVRRSAVGERDARLTLAQTD